MFFLVFFLSQESTYYYSCDDSVGYNSSNDVSFGFENLYNDEGSSATLLLCGDVHAQRPLNLARSPDYISVESQIKEKQQNELYINPSHSRFPILNLSHVDLNVGEETLVIEHLILNSTILHATDPAPFNFGYLTFNISSNTPTIKSVKEGHHFIVSGENFNGLSKIYFGSKDWELTIGGKKYTIPYKVAQDSLDILFNVSNSTVYNVEIDCSSNDWVRGINLTFQVLYDFDSSAGKIGATFSPTYSKNMVTCGFITPYSVNWQTDKIDLKRNPTDQPLHLEYHENLKEPYFYYGNPLQPGHYIAIVLLAAGVLVLIVEFIMYRLTSGQCSCGKQPSESEEHGGYFNPEYL